MKKTTKTQSEGSKTMPNRRQFLGNIGKAGLLAAALGSGTASQVLAQKEDLDILSREDSGSARALQAYRLRVSAAAANYRDTARLPARQTNGDEQRYPNKIASYSKGLPHQANGEVVISAFNKMVAAANSGSPAVFNQIPLGGSRKLTSPQSGFAFDLEGLDAFSYVQPPPPKFSSLEEAAEIAENYWMALMRDISFTGYSANAISYAAAADLNLFGNSFKGPKDSGGQVTPDLLFRGLTPGDKAGPLMSQFWYLPCFFGANEINQKIRTVKSIADGGRNYMTDFASWLSIQNGAAPSSGDIFDPVYRYMRNGRDLGEWVHIDVLFQGYFQAFLVLAGLGAPADSGNPYSSSANQAGFATFGGPHIATLLCEVSTRALKAVWNQKWLVHRRLRPEAFGERVDRVAHHGASYPVHSEILASVASSSRLGGYLPAGNAFLPQAFPEGSPTHPAYGAGHATVAGACTTILKAWFDESFVIPNPVVPDASGQNLLPYTGSDSLTVGGELNKIASNVALGRNIAGVHWRSDATESLKLGEAVAISVLRDQKACYNEQFNGFSLTKFDGTTITV